MSLPQSHYRLKVKVCGMRDLENIQDVTALNPSYMGFIFYTKSPRNIGPEFVMPDLSNEVQKVGVFVDATFEKMLETARQHGLDVLQLHGKEAAEMCARLKSEGFQIWKAIPIASHLDFGQLGSYAECVDAFLFDTKGKAAGGNGYAFNWELLRNYKLQNPFILSGGIGPDDAKTILKLTDERLIGIDLNSRFETQPAVKDADLLKTFIHQIQKGEQ